MKRAIYTLIFSMLLVPVLFAQTSHTVVANGLSFTPQNLTIQVGDTVVWDNQGGFHNVNGDQSLFPGNPESFGSGPAAMAPWTYSHVFNTAGNYDYQCDVHAGSGMTGTITVQAAAGPESDVVITEIMYNNPGTDDYEFIELYNRGSAAVDMTGWSFSQGVTYTFGNYSLDAGSYVIVAIDSAAFEAAFNVPAFQFTGGLNNGGESIVLVDGSGAVMDSVSYDDEGDWPTEPDGGGPTLVLCDPDSDNADAANWQAAITPTGVIVSGMEILGNPGGASICPGGPLISFIGSELTLTEDEGNVILNIALSNGNGMPIEVSLEINAASTATAGDDFEFIPPAAVAFNPGNVNDTVSFIIPIIDDSDIESLESIIVDLTNPTNGAEIAPTGGTFTINIVDNDTPSAGALLISGVFDTQPAGAGVKGWELKAIKNIPDLSIYGVGSANNGGGSNGVEATLPPIPLDSGQCFFVASNADDFMAFFGFPADLVTDAAFINGDDAIELFENGIVVDVFGDINTDGTGEPWEYTDGWAYRKSGTGPDGNIFQLDNWTFSGIDVFDDVPNNASAPVPFPTCTYSVEQPDQVDANDDNATTDVDTPVDINLLGNDVTPNPLVSITIVQQPDNGTVTATIGTDATYTPNPGFCGNDSFTYELCDAIGCDTATVFITVICPPDYPAYDIATVTTVDAEGMPDSLGVSCQLQGIVYGVDLQGNDNIQFFFADATGGISLFSSNNFGYVVTEGDEVIVQGKISQFNCLTQITPDTLWMVSSGNALKDPVVTTVVDESTESELIRINDLTLVDPGQWTGTGAGFNVDVTNGTQTFTMRIDNDVDLYSMPAPTGTFHAIGLGGQFDPNAPCDAGYQFLPRYMEDIIPATPTKEEILGSQISFGPNPAGDALFVNSTVQLDRISISNMLGQQLISYEGDNNRLDISKLVSGMYLISFTEGNTTWTTRFVKR
ncbi:MAG: hypothetical protein Kow0027_25130 [Saprospiraceae bacterium]